MEAITISNLSKHYGSLAALDDVSFQIQPNELFFLLGSSGCGKSTLLRSIAGLETPSAGTIHFGERDVTKLPTHQREAAMVFQSYALWPHMTVAENIAFGLKERKVSKRERQERVQVALEQVQLSQHGERRIDQLSGGQQQRVALARALVVRPRCLLLDEPLSNLDAKLRVEMRTEIRRIVKDEGLTAVYVTHDQEEALAMADRIAIMSSGKVAQIGNPHEVYKKPISRHVAQFVGETNFIEGTVLQSGERVEVDTKLGVIETADVRGRSLATGQRVTLSLRPECLSGRAVSNRVSGEVIESVYLGREVRSQMRTQSGICIDISVANPSISQFESGLSIEVGIDPSDVVLLTD